MNYESGAEVGDVVYGVDVGSCKSLMKQMLGGCDPWIDVLSAWLFVAINIVQCAERTRG